jgi:hypothetical protein
VATSAIFGGHGLAFTFIGLYFLAFQVLHGQHTTIGSHPITLPDIKWGWDHFLSKVIPIMSQHEWDHWRHLFRDDGEPFMASLGIGFFLYNPYARSVKIIDSPWHLALRILMAIAILVPVLVIGNLAITALAHSLHSGLLTNVETAHPNFVQKIYTDGNVASKIFTIIAGLIASKFVMPPVYDYTIRYFARRKVARGKHTHFYHAPAYQALVNGAYAEEGDSQARAKRHLAGQSDALNRVMFWGGLAAVTLAGLGIYVTAYIA